jgi:hypothetical protein
VECFILLYAPRIEMFFPFLAVGLREHNLSQISTTGHHCVILVISNPSLVRQSQQTSFNSKKKSNVVFLVENEKPLYVNIDLLTQKSEYFAAMFRSNTREREPRERGSSKPPPLLQGNILVLIGIFVFGCWFCCQYRV